MVLDGFFEISQNFGSVDMTGFFFCVGFHIFGSFR